MLEPLLVSAFVTLGLPEDKAAVYQTRIEAGEFLVAVEVPADKSGEIQLLLESVGGEEVHTNETPLPRKRSGSLKTPVIYPQKFALTFQKMLKGGLLPIITRLYLIWR